MTVLSKERFYITRMVILSLYRGIANRLTMWISRIIEWLIRGIFSGIMGFLLTSLQISCSSEQRRAGDG